MKTLELSPRSQRSINMGFVKVYLTQLGLVLNMMNGLISLQFHIILVIIVLCFKKHSPRYISLDKAGHVKELKDQGHFIPIK